MSLIVDTKNIDTELKKMDKYVEEYTNNSYDIFYELFKLNSYWIGSDSSTFFENINRQQKNNLFVIENLKNINTIYKMIKETYEENK